MNADPHPKPFDPLDFKLSVRARRILHAAPALTERAAFLEAGPLTFLKLPGCGYNTTRELLALQRRMMPFARRVSR